MNVCFHLMQNAALSP